ncbi:MAG: hypothetical protein AB1725_11050 [Armatimonadota bacterium]
MSILLTTMLLTISSATQSGGEIRLAEDAVEPTLITNRNPNPDDRVLVVAYMKSHATGGIIRQFSDDQGVSFSDPLGVDLKGGFPFDPTLAANLANGTFYLNWLGQDASGNGTHVSTASPDGDIFGNHTELPAWNFGLDRPWLVAAENHVWMSYVDTGAATGYAFFRAGAVSGSTVTWPATGIVWVPDVLPPLSHNPQAIIARGKCNCGLTPHSDEVYGVAVQMHESDRYDPNNKVKIYRSLNAGEAATSAWSTDPPPVSGSRRRLR